MKNKSFFTSIFLMLVLMSLIIFSQEVYAVGIGSSSGDLSPRVDFKPGLRRTFSYFATPSVPASGTGYEITAEGPLAEYFTLSTNLVKMLPGQSKSFTVTLQLPEKLSPGLHETYICVMEAPSQEGAGIVVKTKACSIVIVRVLYSEKYLKIEGFDVPNVDVGDILNLKISVKSWTEAQINSVKAIIDIFGPSEKGFDKKIASLETEEKPLASNEGVTLHANLATRDFESGEYNAVATVYYDGNEANISARFKVGILAVKVINYTKEVVRNKINKFDIDVESRWNNLIENVYADVNIQDDKNETLRTPAINLKPWETATLTTYYDATGKKVQYYEGKIILYFAGNSTEQDIKVKMLVNPEEIKRLMIYVSVTTIIVILIVIIVIISLKKPKSKNKGKKYAKTKKR